MYMYMTVYTCICHVLPLRFGLGGRSGEKRSRKQRDKLRHSFPPEVQKDSQYGAWDGNVARLPCCKFDPSHRSAMSIMCTMSTYLRGLEFNITML